MQTFKKEATARVEIDVVAGHSEKKIIVDQHWEDIKDRPEFVCEIHSTANPQVSSTA